MSKWGTVDKRSIVHILDNGLGFLKDEIKDQSRTKNQNEEDFYSLEQLLYNEGKELLSMTNQTRFEKRLNTIRKNMHKWV
ncbi:hypothetical protein Q7A53_05755 [Halobacillus rhizosphaerae]|uniref:hypothetical protein n=1 Tax=Halobacillus rhizosphaerae TaxID=3064889 RepID=UPI00398B7344